MKNLKRHQHKEREKKQPYKIKLLRHYVYNILFAEDYDDRSGISWKSFVEINGRNSEHKVREIIVFNFILF